MPTLSVAYVNDQLSVTGGDNNGPDVTILFGQNATITWNRVGTNFKFKELTLEPATGPFTAPRVTDGMIAITDNDTNQSGKDQEFKYTITYKDSAGNIKKYDPKVINKSRINMALLERLGLTERTY